MVELPSRMSYQGRVALGANVVAGYVCLSHR